jgi:hypothetical protein
LDLQVTASLLDLSHRQLDDGALRFGFIGGAELVGLPEFTEAFDPVGG